MKNHIMLAIAALLISVVPGCTTERHYHDQPPTAVIHEGSTPSDTRAQAREGAREGAREATDDRVRY
jgi:hypothetical protein